MAKNQPAEKSINLGMRQKQVEHTTAVWRASRAAKFKADQEFEDAEEKLETAIALLNQAEEKLETAIALLNQDVTALKFTCGIDESAN